MLEIIKGVGTFEYKGQLFSYSVKTNDDIIIKQIKIDENTELYNELSKKFNIKKEK